MESISVSTYTEDDKDIVRKGISEIEKVLLGEDTNKKLSMLLCLDWFMDPYYQQDISNIHDDLILLLQRVIIEAHEDDVIDDAINLLTSYAWPPFPLIEKNRDRIPQKFQPDISYLLDDEKMS